MEPGYFPPDPGIRIDIHIYTHVYICIFTDLLIIVLFTDLLIYYYDYRNVNGHRTLTGDRTGRMEYVL